MALVQEIPKNPVSGGKDLGDWWYCQYEAESVIVIREVFKGNVYSKIGFMDYEDELIDGCYFIVPGNPYKVFSKETFSIVDPASARTLAPLANALLDSFRYGTADGLAWKVSGLNQVSASTFLSILTNGDSTQAYRDFVALFDSNDLFRGGSGADRLDPGAGNDRVVGGGGDDIAHKWKAGNLVFDGGTGHDTLDFAAYLGGDLFPSTAVETLRIDLAQGTGRSPWGGKVTLASVEEIRDTDGRDVILGSRRADTVASDFGGGDVFRLGGGDDTVRLFARAEDLTYNGGKGRDTLVISLGAGDNALDLGNAGANAGVFAGARISGVEVISASSVWTGSTFRFVGTTTAEEVTFAAGTFAGTPFARAVLALGGGNDRALGGAGDDAIAGGHGRDILDGGGGDDDLRGGGGADRFHFTADFGHDLIEDFDPAADKLDFRDHSGVTTRRDLVIREAGDDVTISDGAGGLVTLVGVDRGDIGAEHLLV